MDIHERIRQLMLERGWTEYRLSKEAGLSQSTISNLFRRNTVPGVMTLEALCKAFGITLAQFFSEGEEIGLSAEQVRLSSAWNRLTETQKRLLLELMETMHTT